MSAAHAPIPSALPGGLAAAGGSSDGGDDEGNDPSRRARLDPTHAVDADPVFPQDDDGDNQQPEEDEGDVPQRKRPSEAAGPDGPKQCNICNKDFSSTKALHGHMRSHPLRKWRGTVPPSLRPGAEQEVADSLLLLSGQEQAAPRKRRFICSGCNREFPTRQALGGHRASHKNQKGCYEKAREAREYGHRVSRPTKRARKTEEMVAEPLAAVPPPQAAEAMSTPTRPAEGSTSRMTRRELDLNLLPASLRRRKELDLNVLPASSRTRKRKLDLNLVPASSSGDTSGGTGGSGSSSSSAKGKQRSNKVSSNEEAK